MNQQQNNPTAGACEAPMTVVVPVYNREKLLLRTLDSIYAQTFRPLRLIVVDNNSTDGSREAARQWISTHNDAGFEAILLEERRKGAANARQRGLEQTTTEYVMFFDSDDEMSPTAVATALKALRNNPEADIAAWRICIHDFDGSKKLTHTLKGDPMTHHLLHTILSTQRCAVRTEYIKRQGGWNGKVKGWDDYELGVRLLLDSPKITWIEKIMCDVYLQEESLTGTGFSGKEWEWELALDEIEKALQTSSHPRKERYLRYVDYRRALLAGEYRREGNPENADRLYCKAMSANRLTSLQKGFLRICHFAISHGVHGTGLIAPMIL